jgi:hypothetical protein
MKKILTAVGALMFVSMVLPRSLGAQNAPVPLTVQDHIEIEQLYAKYYHAFDSGDPEAWASVFTEDGVFNGTKGQEALKAVIRNSTANGTTMRHWTSNLLLTPVPGGVQGKVYVMQIDISKTPIAIATYSRYDDVIVKTSRGWRFKQKMRSTDTTMGAGRAGGPARQPGTNGPGRQ